MSSGHIVVGYDGSADADLAVAWAVDEARSRNVGLRVLIACGDWAHLSAWAREQAEALTGPWAERARTLLLEAGMPTNAVEVVDGVPVTVLVEASRHAVLTVLGAHGHGRLWGTYMGSISQHVARHAHGPVVVVRPKATPTAERIVVGVDGSPESRSALEFACDLAGRTAAEVVAVHGWRIPTPAPTLAMGYYPGPMGDETADRERMLAEAVTGLGEKFPDVVVHRLTLPVPAVRALADASHQAALVVVGATGHGGFAELLLGSTSQAVLHHAQCPVAIVR